MSVATEEPPVHVHHVSPAASLLLCEHPQDEASFAVRLEGGRDDDIFSRLQFEAVTHFPQVDEVFTASHRLHPQQDVRAQVDVTATFKLTTKEESCRPDTSTCRVASYTVKQGR